jgi:hypothetical protein
MQGNRIQLVLLCLFAVALLVTDRILRIEPALRGRAPSREPFQNAQLIGADASSPGQRCGLEGQMCPDTFRCANGFCISEVSAAPKERAPLPVV